MTGQHFRDLAGRVASLIERYWDGVDARPVRATVTPGALLEALPARAPEAGEASLDRCLADVERLVLPALTHWQSANFYAYFPSNISSPSVLGEFLSAGLGVQGMLWATSPAATELEMRVLDWLGGAIGLPDPFLFGTAGARASGGGVIQGTASDAALAALVAGRWRTLRSLPENARRAALPRLTAYTSTQAHSSILKAAMIAGLALGPEDHEQFRLVPVREDLSMDPAALESMLRADVARGLLPCFVSATLGTTSSTAIDPLDAVGGAIRGVCGSTPWLHVDAAHSGSACVCPEHRAMLRGIELADSFCFNPHKWLLTNFDCNCFWTRDRASLTGAMSVTPEYLRNAPSDAGAVVDYRDWHVPLGRRFRALKLWFVLRYYGLEGLRSHIRHGVRLAALFEELARSDARFEVAAERSLNLVCFRLSPRAGEAPEQTDARNRELLERLNATGRLYLSHTVLPGSGPAPARYVLRMAIGAVRTREEHVRAAWDLIAASAG
ncbi:MAG: aspartate aminotransferase family protein [Leptolyngbya sp. PLA1]|nr:aspartate aminotransferase family protein [Leptolyngbya sp. PLA1]